MNILFLISSGDKGAGGHFNSLFQISSEIGKRYPIKIILLGKGDSPIIKESPYFEKHIPVETGFRDLFLLRKELDQIFNSFNPDIIHCFDTDSLNRVLLAYLFKLNLPVVLNKCGGRNPLNSNYQHANAIVVFSKENHEWFINNRNYREERIFLIPNRVRKLNPIPKANRLEKPSDDKLSFLRISRLGGAYESTLLQTFNLLDRLSEKIPVELFIVGTIQNQERFHPIVEIAESKPYPVKFIVDERAYRGSDFLYLADFAIGTGRSFMEATSLGIPTLTPAKNTDIPILVDKRNIDQFLATNFSERNIASENSEQETLMKVEKAFIDLSYRAGLQAESKEIFDEFFGTDKILEKYEKVYGYVLKQENHKINLIRKNFLYLVKSLTHK